MAMGGGFGLPRSVGLGKLGWPKPPQGPTTVVRPPPRAKRFFIYLFLDLAIGGSRTTLFINELFIFSLLFYYLFFLVENNIFFYF
jgi:hypothetical protein